MKREGFQLSLIPLSSIWFTLFLLLLHPGLFSQVSSPCLDLDSQYDDFTVCVDQDFGFPGCTNFSVTMDLTDVDFTQFDDPLLVEIRIPLIFVIPEGFPVSPLSHNSSNATYISGNFSQNFDSYIFLYEIDDESIQEFNAIFSIRNGKYGNLGAVAKFFTVNLLSQNPIQQEKVLSVSWISESEWFEEVFKFERSMGGAFEWSVGENPVIYENASINFGRSGGSNEFAFVGGRDYELKDMTFYLEQDLQVIIESGAKVTMENCLLLGCSNMWETIKVEPGGELIMEDCEIRDGFKAITLTDGGVYKLKNNTFTNNFITFYAEGSGLSGQTVSFSDIKGNTIQSEVNKPFLSVTESMAADPLYFDFGGKGYAGLYVTKRIVDFMESPFYLDEDVNHFTNLHFGMIADQATLSASTSRFSNIRNTIGTLEDEGAALYNKNNSILRFRGSYLNLTEKTFENCKYGLLSRDGVISSLARTKLDNCTYGAFLENTKLLGRVLSNEILNAEVGVRVIDQNQVSENVGITRNTIECSRKGIWVYGLSASSTGNEILVDASNEVNFAGTAGISYHGLEMGDTDPDHSLRKPRIIRNKVTANSAQHGILVDAGYGFHILDNIVKFSNAPQFSFVYGVKFSGGDEHQVRTNCITQISDNYARSEKGLFIQDGEGFTIRCNQFENLTFASRAHINLSGGMPQTDLAGNRMAEFDPSGLTPGNDLLLGRDDNGRAAIDEQRYRGNMWAYPQSPPSAYSRALHLSGIPEDYEYSEILIDISLSTNATMQGVAPLFFEPKPVVPILNWVKKEIIPLSENQFYCNMDPVCERSGVGSTVFDPGNVDILEPVVSDLTPLRLTNLKQDIIYESDSLDLGVYSFGWQGRRYLYNTINNGPNRQIAYELDTATAHWGNEDFAILADLRHDLSTDLYAEDQLLKQWVNPNEVVIDSVSLDSIQLDSVLIALVDSVNVRRESIWEQFMSDNENFVGENPAASLEATVNQAMAQFALGTNIESQLDPLLSIASSCGMTEGGAVYEARALINGNLDSLFVDLNPCIVPDSALERGKVVQEQTDFGSQVYPNPTSDQISIILDKTWDRADVLLYDVEGRLMWSKRSVRSGSSHRLPASRVSGTYYLELINSENANQRDVLPLIINR